MSMLMGKDGPVIPGLRSLPSRSRQFSFYLSDNYLVNLADLKRADSTAILCPKDRSTMVNYGLPRPESRLSSRTCTSPPFDSVRIFCLSLIVAAFHLGPTDAKAQHIESWGVFAGMNFPFTIDQGLRNDPRYYGKLTLRATPVGVAYGYDRVGHGFVITPSYLKIGQKYIIRNTTGGDVGTRDIKMDYISVPIALKLHLNDLSFFRLSVVASINFDYLINGQEIVTHSASKLNYPPGVIIPDDPGYVEVYDGVIVPEVNGQVYVNKEQFKSFQVSAGVGFRSDFDFNEDWSMNFDGRAVFGIFDPRDKSYIEELQGGTTAQPATDLYGQRRDVYLAGTIGISRIIQIKQKFNAKTSPSSGKKQPGKSNKKKKKMKKGMRAI
jgi:hypothetical protein